MPAPWVVSSMAGAFSGRRLCLTGQRTYDLGACEFQCNAPDFFQLLRSPCYRGAVPTSSCSSNGATATRSVYPSPLTVRVGQSTQLYGGLRDRYNRPVECLSNTPSWTLADSTIAAIDRGLVTGLSVGTTRITGVSGSLSATAVVTVVAP